MTDNCDDGGQSILLETLEGGRCAVAVSIKEGAWHPRRLAFFVNPDDGLRFAEIIASSMNLPLKT